MRVTGTTAFTLIELSVVMIIIGLVIGGVIVGQDLVKAAQIRAQVSEFGKYNSALNTFRSKYGCMPGDCPNAIDVIGPAASTGVYWDNGYCPYCANGSGDGLLLAGETAPQDSPDSPYRLQGEPTLFWIHLWVAKLASCCDPLAGNGPGMSAANFNIGGLVPADKVNGGGVSASVMNGVNGYYWGITRGSASLCTPGCPGGNNADNLALLSSGAVLSPVQARAFDSKIDDGLPNSGKVYAAAVNGGDNRVHMDTGWSGACVAATTPASYGSGTSSLCNLWISMQGM